MKEKREYKKSELLDMIKDGFYEIENECSDIELGCFGDEDVESFSFHCALFDRFSIHLFIWPDK